MPHYVTQARLLLDAQEDPEGDGGREPARFHGLQLGDGVRLEHESRSGGLFSGRGALRTTAIRIPKELNITDAQIKAAEAKTDKPLEAKRLKALKACRDFLVTHELAHIDKAWDSLSEVSLGWEKKLGTLASDTTVTAKHIEDALTESDTNAPTKIAASAKKWDDDDLGPLRTRFRGEHIFLNKGEDATFDYIEPAGGGG